MNILIDVNHPADVHQFKHVIRSLNKKHKVLVVARDKEITYDLLKNEKISFVPRKGYYNFFSKLFGFILIDFTLFTIAKKFKPNVVVGSSGNLYVTHAAALLRKPSVIFDDTEHSTIQNLLCFPFATKIVTPKSYTLDLGKKQVRYEGSKELAYLTKPYFKPKKGKKSIFIRLVSWDASHDIGRKGFDIEALVTAVKGKVIISSEGELPFSLKKYEFTDYAHIHDALYNAEIVISEGGTTAVESAILGTPTIYINPLRLGYVDEWIKKKRMVQVTSLDKVIALIPTLKGKRKPIFKPSSDLNKFMEKEITCMHT